MNIQQLFDLKGKTAIVTGGYTGLGLQATIALADAGADVVICSRKVEYCREVAEKIEREYQVSALGLRCDVSIEDEVDKLVNEAVSRFGKIDILVNNAGVTWGEPPEKMSLQNWEKVLRINLTGTFLMSQRVGRVMIENKRGKIINISSLSALRGMDYLNAVGYVSSKGAVISLTRDLAVNWAPYNINVNAVCPSFFETEMIEKFFKLEGKKEKILGRTPMNRLGSDYDLKGTIVFLSSAASDYITGSIIVVDGGYSAS